MSKVVDCFDAACEKYRDRTAFYDLVGGRLRLFSFEDLKKDVERVQANLLEQGVKKRESIMLFVSPSYELLVFMMACLKIGASLMIIDVWAGRKLIQKTFEEYRADYIAVSKNTSLLRHAFREIGKIKKVIFIERVYGRKPQKLVKKKTIRDKEVAVLTMTTGSTGRPKILLRSHRDLYHQFELVRNNMDQRSGGAISLNTSFMYHFVNLLNGYTGVLLPAKKARVMQFIYQRKGPALNHIPIEVLFTTPDFCLETDHVFPKLEELYVGGAILNLYEALTIREKFPKARITYIYGATECNLIAQTNLDDYISALKEGKIVLGSAVNGVRIKTDEDGEIMVNAEVVLSDYLNPEHRRGLRDEEGRYWHKTGDAGRFEQGLLYYLGRRDIFVKTREGEVYSNELEQDIVRTFPGIRKCACFYHRGNNYILTEGDFSDEEALSLFVKQKGLEGSLIKCGMEIPCDAKHHSKIHYNLLKKLTERWMK